MICKMQYVIKYTVNTHSIKESRKSSSKNYTQAEFITSEKVLFLMGSDLRFTSSVVLYF